MINKKDILVRQAVVEDKDSIINLLNDVFIKQQRSHSLRDNDYFDWKFLNSPFGKSILTVSEYNGEIVGVDHLWPWKLDYKNETIKAYEACDSAVKSEYRGNRLLQRMRTFGIDSAKENNAALLFNFPNNQSLKTNINYGYHFLGKINWWVRVIKPIDVASLYLNLKNKSSKNKSDIEYKKIDLHLLEYLYKKYTPKYLMTIHRSINFFMYRYVHQPKRNYGMISNNNEIAAIYTVNDNNGTREMVITDLIGNRVKVNKLLKRIIYYAKKYDCAFIAIMSDNYLLNNWLWSMGFVRKKEKNFVVYPINDMFRDISTNFSSWNMSASMHDSI